MPDAINTQIDDILNTEFPGFEFVDDNLYKTSSIDPGHALGFIERKVKHNGEYFKVLFRDKKEGLNINFDDNSILARPKHITSESCEIIILPIDAINLNFFNFDEVNGSTVYQLLPQALDEIGNFYSANPDLKEKMESRGSKYSIFVLSLTDKKVYTLL